MNQGEELFRVRENKRERSRPLGNITAEGTGEAVNSVHKAILDNAQAHILVPMVYSFTVSSAFWRAANVHNLSPGAVASYAIASQEGYRDSAALTAVLHRPQAQRLAQQLPPSKHKA
ncbi:hypothetical protein D2Q93_02525 [Alicyclobacillaceae bacterium I2511]|nr:hypothetical protein D2Q93_02525 [Alicyclobacillaceae bacterium I2511]